MFRELAGKIILVIGGKEGIGEAVVKTFLQEKAIVIDADIAYPHELKKISPSTYQVHLDVAKEDQVKKLVDTLEAQNLVPDILIHGAGISTMDYFLDSQTEDFEKNWRVNTQGFYFTAKHVGNLFSQHHKKGKIIVLASQAGKNGYRGMSPYVASKHGVLGLVKTLAIELASQQINVNAVCPGIIETAMKKRERIEGAEIRGLTPAEIEAEDNSQVPLGRTGQPQDVANVVLFLASHLADYMTGQGINVTGGMTMH